MKKLFNRKVGRYLLVFLAGVVSLLVFQLLIVFSYTIRPGVEVPDKVKDSLVVLMRTAKEKGETPISAIITYNDSIVASGYNTVKTEADHSKHAEVNAINSLVNKIGYHRFYNELDRKNLVLYTTFDPCQMCTGVLIHFRVKNVVILNKKTVVLNLFYKHNYLRYYYRRRAANLSDAERQEQKRIRFSD